ncbi:MULTISPECIES: hypothetical protein [unclassified Sphingomonas]|uniref:hypothetical protein n=1 Tax=unclassified Sphingomonas TaxID=196159 RepID=UPI00226A52BC|nr:MULTISPECIES: hypothetical protein [unclassified Sphingomonas]
MSIRVASATRMALAHTTDLTFRRPSAHPAISSIPIASSAGGDAAARKPCVSGSIQSAVAGMPIPRCNKAVRRSRRAQFNIPAFCDGAQEIER